MLFDFMQDYDNYEDRVIGLWDNDDNSMMVSTAAVSDGREPFETAVAHPSYNNGKMIIVECYSTEEDAAAGHKKWLGLMRFDKLPLTLVDCGNSEISQLIDAIDGDMAFEKNTTLPDSLT